MTKKDGIERCVKLSPKVQVVELFNGVYIQRIIDGTDIRDSVVWKVENENR